MCVGGGYLPTTSLVEGEDHEELGSILQRRHVHEPMSDTLVPEYSGDEHGPNHLYAVVAVNGGALGGGGGILIGFLCGVLGKKRGLLNISS